ncbi:MAG TPA: hypothetical protein VFA50_14580 [Stellaceae bacterium]|nr:hypothetical protein [Stellaceae bacterium]
MTGSIRRRWRVFCGFALLALALAACELAPSPPLMSPIQVAKYYGYSEVPIGNGRYDVSYLGPSHRSLRSPTAWEATSAAERTQAYDFALWRAAQIALAEGYAGFRTSNVRSNVNTFSDDYYDPFCGPWGPWYGPGFYPHRFWGYPYPYCAPSPYADQQTAVTIEVQLLHSLGPGDYNAADVIAQLRRTYPGAEGTTVPTG